MALIEARALGKTYGSKRAVDDLSFVVQPGSVTGFLGPNGSGKSTTMRLMLGLDRGEGATTFDGKTFAELEHPMRHVGALLEAKPFHPTRPRPRPPADARRGQPHLPTASRRGHRPGRALDASAEVKPGKFSLGMGQRLGIAAALLGDPHTLILDEPSNGLDPQGITWLRTLLKHLAARGARCSSRATCCRRWQCWPTSSSSSVEARCSPTAPSQTSSPRSGLGTVEVRTPDAALLPRCLERSGATVDADGDELVVVRSAPPSRSAMPRTRPAPGCTSSPRVRPPSRRPSSRPPGLAEEFRGTGESVCMIDALRYEYVRLRTIRSTYWLIGLALAFQLVMSMVIASQLLVRESSAERRRRLRHPRDDRRLHRLRTPVHRLHHRAARRLLDGSRVPPRNDPGNAHRAARPYACVHRQSGVHRSCVAALAALACVLVALLASVIFDLDLPRATSCSDMSAGTVIFTVLFSLSGLAFAALDPQPDGRAVWARPGRISCGEPLTGETGRRFAS